MSIVKKDELLAYVKENGRDLSALSEITDDFAVENCSEEPGVSGYVFVKVEEGTMLIPYGNVLVDEGNEQLLLDDYRMVDSQVIEQTYNDMIWRANKFKEIFG